MQKLFDVAIALLSEEDCSSLKDEYDILCCLQRAGYNESFREMILEWIASLQETNSEDSYDVLVTKSHELRQRGNELFKISRLRNALAACRLYTKAIFVAPRRTEALSLAYANRAMTLQTFGYYQQAYDDCTSALREGYPKRSMHKVYLRQACCALALGDTASVARHLNEVEETRLNENCRVVLDDLRKGLHKLVLPRRIDAKANFHFDPQHESQAIRKSESKGRFMVTKKAVKVNEVIFAERCTSFVPLKGLPVCQQCAATQLIPMPCHECGGKAVYCSLRCMAEHAPTHAHECAAYKMEIFANVGIAHLALRMVLDGLPSIVGILAEKRCPMEIWQALNSKTNDDLLSDDRFEYVKSLRMMSHLQEIDAESKAHFGMIANVMVFYLTEYTRFFELFNATACTRSDWQTLIGALILRHIGQLICNGHSCISLVYWPQDDDDQGQFTVSPLLASRLWERPKHLRRGCLSQFSSFEKVIAANFPYLSLCNHSCVPSFQPCFSGRFVTTFATSNLNVGDEILNCYTPDHRHTMRIARENMLDSIYFMKCDCEKCIATIPDEDYNKFHRYRCKNVECGEIFVPSANGGDHLNWWESTDGAVECPICHADQELDVRYERFCILAADWKNPFARKELLYCYESFDKILVGCHELKLILASMLMLNTFTALRDGLTVNDDEFYALIDIAKFSLYTAAIRWSANSIVYISQMTFLWDLVALKKYMCERKEMDEMLAAIEFISEEMKEIFANYYKDYIAPQMQADDC